jgi:protein SCO1/2
VASRRLSGLLVAVLAGLGLLAGCGGSSQGRAAVSGVSVQEDDNLHGIVLPKPYRVPSVTLRDTADKPYDLATRADKPLTLVFFGYTHCPDICQLVMADITSGLNRLDAGQRSKVGMVFVTTDPARDTSSVLRSYLRRFDPAYQGLTGGLPAIERLAKPLGVAIIKGQKLASGGYDVSHGTNVVGVRPGRTAPYVWTQGTSPADLASDVTKILAGKVVSK